jgi:hypothetical protein
MTAHGEDRPSNGVVRRVQAPLCPALTTVFAQIYIFDVVEVVANPEDPAARYRLRLVFKEKLKAPITTITDINGFLVVTMGQKVSRAPRASSRQWLTRPCSSLCAHSRTTSG